MRWLVAWMRNGSVWRRLAFGIGIAGLPLSGVQGQTNQPMVLVLEWIGVVDDGEGDAGFHGPTGNLHLAVLNGSNGFVSESVLRGPTNNEFRDGDQAWYDPPIALAALIFPGDRVRLIVWESDSAGFFGDACKFLTGETHCGLREHEVLFDGWIRAPGLYPSAIPAVGEAVENVPNVLWLRPLWQGGAPPALYLKIGFFPLSDKPARDDMIIDLNPNQAIDP